MFPRYQINFELILTSLNGYRNDGVQLDVEIDRLRLSYLDIEIELALWLRSISVSSYHYIEITRSRLSYLDIEIDLAPWLRSILILRLDFQIDVELDLIQFDLLTNHSIISLLSSRKLKLDIESLNIDIDRVNSILCKYYFSYPNKNRCSNI